MSINKMQGHFKWVDIEQINMPGGYQRAVCKTRVNAIAKIFDPDIAFPLNCNIRPNGKIYLWDGQHRFHAAVINGYKQVYCKLDEFGGYEEEAARFHEAQGRGIRANLTMMQIFVARVESGKDEIANKLHQISKELGFRYCNSSGSARACKAINIVETVFNKYGEETLREALKILLTAWGDESNALDGLNIYGLSHLIHEAQHVGDAISASKFIEKLRQRSPADIKRLASHHEGIIGGRPYKQFSAAFLKVYNHGNKHRSRPGMITAARLLGLGE